MVKTGASTASAGAQHAAIRNREQRYFTDWTIGAVKGKAAAFNP